MNADKINSNYNTYNTRKNSALPQIKNSTLNFTNPKYQGMKKQGMLSMELPELSNSAKKMSQASTYDTDGDFEIFKVNQRSSSAKQSST